MVIKKIEKTSSLKKICNTHYFGMGKKGELIIGFQAYVDKTISNLSLFSFIY